MLNAQIVKNGALIDAKEHLAGIDSIVTAGVIRERRLAALQPAIRPVAGVFHVVVRRRDLDALVKRHRNIRAKIGLNAHALFWPHENVPAVHMAVEGNAFFRDLPKLRQRKDLESAAVGQNRFFPGHEFVQAAQVADQFVAGTHVQVVRVGQLDLAADRLQILRRERALDGRLRADIHEHRRLHRTVRRCERAAARMAVFANQLKHSLLAFLFGLSTYSNRLQHQVKRSRKICVLVGRRLLHTPFQRLQAQHHGNTERDQRR